MPVYPDPESALGRSDLQAVVLATPAATHASLGLRALDANLNLTLGALQFQRMTFSNVALGLRVANGAADARLTRISMYDGGGTAQASSPFGGQSDNPFGGDGGMGGMGGEMMDRMLQERFGYWIALTGLIVAAGAGAFGMLGGIPVAAKPDATPPPPAA